MSDITQTDTVLTTVDHRLLLKIAREATGLTRKEVADRVKIPEIAIAQFEDGIPHDKTEDIYTKIYLKAYTKFLGVEHPIVFADLRASLPSPSPLPSSTLPSSPSSLNSVAPITHPRTSIPRTHLIGVPQMIRIALASVVVVSLTLYLVFELKRIFAPPTVTLLAPQDGYSTTDNRIVLEGKTEPEVLLRINGKDLSPDSTGAFKDTIDLQEGVNTLKIIARKKHSDTIEITRRIFVQPKGNPTAEVPTVGSAVQ